MNHINTGGSSPFDYFTMEMSKRNSWKYLTFDLTHPLLPKEYCTLGVLSEYSPENYKGWQKR